MPKLDGTHTAQRLQSRLDQLLRDEQVAARDIKALLTKEQQTALDTAWTAQQVLRKQKRARTSAEQAALSWKTKRDIQIQALTQAVHAASDHEQEAWDTKLQDAEVRQGRIYFDEINKQTNAGVDIRTAKVRANNKLQTADLKRLDGQPISTQGMSRRDREVRSLENAIQDKAESEMDEYEREQLALRKEHEKAAIANKKRRSR